MARIALIKPFTGLNLGVSQLAGELQRAGHECIVVYFKDFYAAPADQTDRHEQVEIVGEVVGARGMELIWNCFRPITEVEHALLIDLLRGFRPDCIGFSLTSTGFDFAGQVTRRVRQALGVPVVWGGAGPTLEPDVCIQHADVVCLGEGEETIVEMASRLDQGLGLEGLAGTWVRTGAEIVKGERRSLLDLERVAIPSFDPRRTFHIENDTLVRDRYPRNLGRQYAIMTSRGCPFSCSFCIESVYQDMFGKRGSLRRRSVDVVIEELVATKATYGVTSVMFYDDVFTTHRKWLAEFAPRYREQVGLPFWCYTYPTTTRREDVALLKEAGCVSMTMGLQSGSQRILDAHFNRPAPLSRAVESAQMILDAGIECFVDLISEVEFETEEDVRATFDFLTTLPIGVQTVGFAKMVKFPGYGYTEQCERAGRKPALTAEDYRYYHRLYLLALTSLPRSLKLAVGRDPVFRRSPELIERFLPPSGPIEFIRTTRVARGEGWILDNGIAQAVIGRDGGSLAGNRAEPDGGPARQMLPVIG